MIGSQCMSLSAVRPEMIVGAAALTLPAVAGWVRGRARAVPSMIAAIALAAAMVLTAAMLGQAPGSAFCGTYAVDSTRAVFQLLIEAGALVSLLVMAAHFRGTVQEAHAPAALLFATLGALGLVAASDLALIVLTIQLMSFGGYVLTALVRSDRLAQEAALKFFLFGASALAVMAYGLTLLYGLTGSLDLTSIGIALRSADHLWIGVALVLVLTGYALEIAAAPLHLWAPDAFQGATAPVAGFLSVVPKIAAVGALIRLLTTSFAGGLGDWPLLVGILAAVSMTYGNLVALRQTSLKRLLAYSTIAQAGYVLMGVAAISGSTQATQAVIYYLLTFLLMNLGVFAVVAMIERRQGHDAVATLDGMGRRAPWAAGALTLGLFSLAGIPPLAGFAGKVLLLSAALDARLTWLVVLAILNMVVGLVYYVRLIARMYFTDAASGPGPLVTAGYAVAVSTVTLGTIVLGIWPMLAIRLIGFARP